MEIRMSNIHSQKILKDIPASGSVHTENLTFWHKYQHKHLEKMLYRAIHLSRNNVDYRRKYPNEARDNPSQKVLSECHKEAHIRILKNHQHQIEFVKVPETARPARFNRIG